MKEPKTAPKENVKPHGIKQPIQSQNHSKVIKDNKNDDMFGFSSSSNQPNLTKSQSNDDNDPFGLSGKAASSSAFGFIKPKQDTKPKNDDDMFGFSSKPAQPVEAVKSHSSDGLDFGFTTKDDKISNVQNVLSGAYSSYQPQKETTQTDKLFSTLNQGYGHPQQSQPNYYNPQINIHNPNITFQSTIYTMQQPQYNPYGQQQQYNPYQYGTNPQMPNYHNPHNQQHNPQSQSHSQNPQSQQKITLNYDKLDYNKINNISTSNNTNFNLDYDSNKKTKKADPFSDLIK